MHDKLLAWLQINNIFPKKNEIVLQKFKDVPYYMKENPYIINGYRPPLSLKVCLKSILVWSNETVNIWSHFISFLIFLILFLNHSIRCVLLKLSSDVSDGGGDVEADKFNVVKVDNPVLCLGLFCYVTCLICSASYHTFRCHSPKAYDLWLNIDLFGISFGMVGCVLPGIHLAFYCIRDWYVFYMCFMFFMVASIISWHLFLTRNILSTYNHANINMLLISSVDNHLDDCRNHRGNHDDHATPCNHDNHSKIHRSSANQACYTGNIVLSGVVGGGNSGGSGGNSGGSGGNSGGSGGKSWGELKGCEAVATHQGSHYSLQQPLIKSTATATSNTVTHHSSTIERTYAPPAAPTTTASTIYCGCCSAPVIFYFVLCSSTALPVCHWVYLNGGFVSLLVLEFLYKVLVMYLLLALSCTIYIFKLPERFFPGRFDFLGSSHQIWHVLIAVGFFWWYHCGLRLVELINQQHCHLQ